MKKLFLLMAACSALAFTSCDNEEIVSEENAVVKNGVKVEIGVAPLLEGTRAIKSGWATGDKINIWFDGDYYNTELPQCVLTYNAATSSWESTNVDAAKLSETGKFFAIYESTNELFEKTYNSDYVSIEQQYLGVNSVSSNPYPSVLVATCGKVGYSYDAVSNIVTANINTWSILNEGQVVITGLTGEPEDYFLSVIGGGTQFYGLGGFGYVESLNCVVPTSSSTNIIGTANEDGIAFYCRSIPFGEAHKYTFTLYDIKNKQFYTYTTAETKTPTKPASGLYGIKIDFSKFAPANTPLVVGSNNVAKGAQGLNFTAPSTGVYRIFSNGFFQEDIVISESLTLCTWKTYYVYLDEGQTCKLDASTSGAIEIEIAGPSTIQALALNTEYSALEDKSLYSFELTEEAIVTFEKAGTSTAYGDIFDINGAVVGFIDTDSPINVMLSSGKYYFVWDAGTDDAGTKIVTSEIEELVVGSNTGVKPEMPYRLTITEAGMYLVEPSEEYFNALVHNDDNSSGGYGNVQELDAGVYEFKLEQYGPSSATTVDVKITKTTPIAFGSGTKTLEAGKVYKLEATEAGLYKCKNEYLDQYDYYGSLVIFDETHNTVYIDFDAGTTQYIVGHDNVMTFEKVTEIADAVEVDPSAATLSANTIYKFTLPADANYNCQVICSNPYFYIQLFSFTEGRSYIGEGTGIPMKAGTYYFKAEDDAAISLTAE